MRWSAPSRLGVRPSTPPRSPRLGGPLAEGGAKQTRKGGKRKTDRWREKWTKGEGQEEEERRRRPEKKTVRAQVGWGLSMYGGRGILAGQYTLAGRGRKRRTARAKGDDLTRPLRQIRANNHEASGGQGGGAKKGTLTLGKSAQGRGRKTR